MKKTVNFNGRTFKEVHLVEITNGKFITINPIRKPFKTFEMNLDFNFTAKD